MNLLYKDVIGEIIGWLDNPSLRSLRLTSKFLYDCVNSKFTSYEEFVRKCIKRDRVMIVCPFFKGLMSTLLNVPNAVFVSTYTHHPISPFPSDMDLLEKVKVYHVDEIHSQSVGNSPIIMIDRRKEYDEHISWSIQRFQCFAKKLIIYSQNFNKSIYDDIQSFDVCEFPFLLKDHHLTKLRFEMYIVDTYDQSLSFFNKKQSRYYIEGYKNLITGNPLSNTISVRSTFRYHELITLFSTFRYATNTPEILTIYLLIPKKSSHILWCKFSVYSFLHLIDVPFYTTYPQLTISVAKSITSNDILEYL